MKRTELKKELDRFLNKFVNADIPNLTRQRLRKTFYDFLLFFYRGEDERADYYRGLSKSAEGFRQELQHWQDEIRAYLLSLFGTNQKWQRLREFNLAFGVYVKKGGIVVKPTIETNIRHKANIDGHRSFGDDFPGIMQYRLGTLLTDLSPLTFSVRTCPKCKDFYTATERKRNICRRCQAKEGKRKWERKNRVALERQRAHLERTGERLPISRFREE